MSENQTLEDLKHEIALLKEREKQLVEVTSLLTDGCSLNTLLDRIVTSLRRVTTSDACSLYLVEENQTLRFAVAHNASKDIPFTSFSIPISSSTLAGHVAVTGEPLRFEDVYDIGDEYPFNFNADFDKNFDYRTKSMLVVPMKNRKNEVVGVVQLINKLRIPGLKVNGPADAEKNVIPYSDGDVDFLNILAGEAAISIERASLYDGIEKLLLGMVESSIAAIESRDKTTAGHSQRIAAYVVVMAKRINKRNDEIWKDINFTQEQIREIFYAAMLHDIGKIGVREHVLNKANKLTDERMEAIHLRIQMQILQEPDKAKFWNDVWDFLKDVNIPKFLGDEKARRLEQIAQLMIRNAKGEETPLLTEFEVENLSVRKGNLTPLERKEIESHVAHSIQILKKVPWTADLKRVPIIAGTHHEKLNGKGYPDGLTRDEIPFGGRMLAVADIFEALTAMDRPYKRAMSIDEALSILQEEVKANALEKDIVDLFIEEKIYAVISDEQRKNFDLTSEEILALE